jgi:hypothetical protein
VSAFPKHQAFQLAGAELRFQRSMGAEALRRWEVGGGRWEVGGGRWAVDGGRWTVDGGRWTVAVWRSLCRRADHLEHFADLRIIRAIAGAHDRLRRMRVKQSVLQIGVLNVHADHLAEREVVVHRLAIEIV